MKLIPLTQGLFAQVDDEDFDYLNQNKWYAHKNGHTHYATRATSRTLGKQKTISMHCEILNTKGIDHIDNNGLNNQKNNLRKATNTQNQANKKKISKATSQYKGVYWNKNAKKWKVQVECCKKQYHIGYFTDEIEAARAYDAKAKELFGEFAKTNF